MRSICLLFVLSLIFVSSLAADVVVTDYSIEVEWAGTQFGLEVSGTVVDQSSNGGTASHVFIGADESNMNLGNTYILAATAGYAVTPSAGHLLTYTLTNPTSDPLTATFRIEGTANFSVSGAQTEGDFSTNAVVGWENENGLVDFAVFNPSSTTNTSIAGDFPAVAVWEVVVLAGQTVVIEVTPAVVTFGGIEIPLGDVNQDGVVNLLDVGPFIDVISSGDFQREADLNQDGAVNLLDVDPFVIVLAGG